MTEAFSSVAAAVRRFSVTAADGAILPVYDFGGPEDAPLMLFGHANGLAAGSQEPWLLELSREARVFAFDARGHGGSEWPEGPLDEVFHVDRFAWDLQMVARAIRARLADAELHYVGHSLGAATALRLAVLGGEPPWQSATLIEPPIFPPTDSDDFAATKLEQDRLTSGSARRRETWTGPEAFYELLKTRAPFARFRDEMLRAHCRATLKPDPIGGGHRLACPPAVESAIFHAHAIADTWQRLGVIQGDHLHLVGADPELPDRGWVSRNMAAISAQIPGTKLSRVPGTGHMMIFQAPEACQALVSGDLPFLRARHA